MPLVENVDKSITINDILTYAIILVFVLAVMQIYELFKESFYELYKKAVNKPKKIDNSVCHNKLYYENIANNTLGSCNENTLQTCKDNILNTCTEHILNTNTENNLNTCKNNILNNCVVNADIMGKNNIFDTFVSEI